MIELYKNFISLVVHPENNQGEEAIGFGKAIILSWPLVMFQVFVAFFLNYAYLARVIEIQWQTDNMATIFKILTAESARWGFLILFFKSLLGMLFFPILAVFDFLVWKTVLRFYFWAADTTEDENLDIGHIMAAAYSSSVFCVIPVLGDTVSFLAKHYLIYRSLRRVAGMDRLASFIVILSPMFFFFIFVMACVFLMGTIFSL